MKRSTSTRATIASMGLAVVFVLSCLPGTMPLPAAAALPIPEIREIVLRGSSNAILGFNATAGLGFFLGGGTTLTLGMTYTERLGYEPLIALSRTTPVASGWNLTLAASRGDFGGDYRVDRLPEITLSKGGSIPGSSLNYGLEAGAGYFIVRPGDLTGFRGVLAGNVTTAPIVLFGSAAPGSAALSFGTGHRQYFYGSGGPHGAWSGSATLSMTPARPVGLTFTYFRQIASGSSPLLFDGMGEENYVVGTLNLRISDGASVQHSQKYSFITSAISERIYGITISLEGGHAVGVSWDDVAQKLSVSLSFRR